MEWKISKKKLELMAVRKASRTKNQFKKKKSAIKSGEEKNSFFQKIYMEFRVRLREGKKGGTRKFLVCHLYVN